MRAIKAPDKGIPIPEIKPKIGNRKYPWLEMEVGDSFVPDTQQTNSVRTMVDTAKNSFSPRKFHYDHDDQGVLRIWRIE